MIRKYYDKIILGLTMAVLLGVFLAALIRPAEQAQLVDIPALRPSNTFEVSEPPNPSLEVPRWQQPPSQSAGPEWVFDVFTPPVIYFNTRTNEFELPDAPPPAQFPIELVSIREEFYRIQLLGWAGGVGDYLINLQNMESGQLILARDGREYPESQFSVRSFKVERIPVPHRGGTSVTQEVGRVVIFDQRLDREVTLHSEIRKKDDESTARFRSIVEPIEEFRARTGDSFIHNGFTYTVDSLDPPARATVTRTGGGEGNEPERRTLIARERGDAPPAPPGASSATPSEGASDAPSEGEAESLDF